jgi:hypothetical protein
MARERLLVAEYLVDLHGADAAIRVSYAARSAQITASRLPAKLTFRRRWPQETFGRCAASANVLPEVKNSVGVPRATGTALIGFSGLRRGRAQERRQELGAVETPLLRGAQNAREDLLLLASRQAVAARDIGRLDNALSELGPVHDADIDVDRGPDGIIHSAHTRPAARNYRAQDHLSRRARD